MIEGELIYLASIYSLDNASKELRKERAAKATWVAGQLIKRGYVVFSPLTHNAPLEELYNLPTSWDFWCRFDATFLLRCDKLMVLTLDGWDRSIGITAEIRLAKLHNIPIEYIKMEDFDYELVTANVETTGNNTLYGDDD